MDEYLTWDGEVLQVMGCITCEDLSSLRSYMTRGVNLTMPGAIGTRPYAPVLDQLDVSLVWPVRGLFAPDGSPHVDRQVGVELNLEHYRTVFTTGADPDTGEHDIILAYAGQTFTGGAQLREYAQVRIGPDDGRIVTRLTVASGELESEGS